MTTHSPDGVVVATALGEVRGVQRALQDHAFFGIPFAQAPVGPLRFSAPQPPTSWTGIRPAISFGPTSQQRDPAIVTTIPEPSIPGKDVLSLNVFTPDPSPDAGLPVLVWIHGGGFEAGSPASPWYDGASFSRDGVVTVTIGYRLGFDGFGWIDGHLPNRGLLDWIAALEWVQSNIAAFGGDPGRVTIAGQSAGGGAVLTLLSEPRAHHLFARVASLSGVPGDLSPAQARNTTARIVDALHQDSAVAGSHGADPARLDIDLTDFLHSVPNDQLTAAAHRDHPQGDDLIDRLVNGIAHLKDQLPFAPIVYGSVRTQSVDHALQTGVGAEKPLLLGSTIDEFSAGYAEAAADFASIDPAQLLDRIGLSDSHAYLETVLGTVPGASTGAVLGQLVTDAIFREPIARWAHARLLAPTWVYDFTWRSPVTGHSEHCMDLPFFFDVLADPDAVRVLGAEAPQSLADAMHQALVAFVAEGDPGWRPVDADGWHTQVFHDDQDDSAERYASARALSTDAGFQRLRIASVDA